MEPSTETRSRELWRDEIVGDALLGLLPLIDRWADIRRELKALEAKHFVAWPGRYLYGVAWDVFGLWAFGKRMDDNCALCPMTAKLVEVVPGMTTAGFSRLAPGTHIRPHRGYSADVLRFHLGLISPAGFALRVGDETHEWRDGEGFAFDDTIEHEAWNRSSEPRVVLLVDFRKACAARPACFGVAAVSRGEPPEVDHQSRGARSSHPS